MSKNGDVRLAGERYGRAVLTAAYRAVGLPESEAEAKATEAARSFSFGADGVLTTDVAAMAAAVSGDTTADSAPTVFAHIRDAAAKRNAEAAKQKEPNLAARFGMVDR